jgi:uncharacterized protein
VIIVSDTTAITSLLKIDRVGLLSDLFGQVVIPTAVRDELLKYHPEVPPFFSIRLVVKSDAVSALRSDIDAGEAEAIVLAEELGADALLIDEKQGRSKLKKEGSGAWG